MNLFARQVLTGIFFLPAFAAAHHGLVTNSGLYLTEELVEIEGEVVEVLWRNPHVRFRVDDGSAVWELEMGPNPRLFRSLGVSQEAIPVGARVTAAGYLSRRDENSLGVLNLLLPDGEEFVERNQTARWTSEDPLDISYRPPSTQDADPDAVAAARATDEGIFRVWAGVSKARSFAQYEPLLTEHAREQRARYDPVTENPELDCRSGMPSPMFDPVPMQIIDEGDRIVVHTQEYDIERTVHMNIDEVPEGIEPSPLGFSVGHWDADTLVVSTTNVGWPLFDSGGTPQSEQIIYTETFEVIEGDVLRYTFSAVDPIMFTAPIDLEVLRGWTPGIELEPYECVSEWQDDVSY